MVGEDKDEDEDDEEGKGEEDEEGEYADEFVLVASGVTVTREVRFDWRKKEEFTVDGRE